MLARGDKKRGPKNRKFLPKVGLVYRWIFFHFVLGVVVSLLKSCGANDPSEGEEEFIAEERGGKEK